MTEMARRTRRPPPSSRLDQVPAIAGGTVSLLAGVDAADVHVTVQRDFVDTELILS